MAHLNRRSTDPDDGQRHRVLDAVESTLAKFIARVVVPILLSVLVAKLFSQGDDIQQVKSDVRVLSTRFDEVALRQVASNTDRIELGDKKNIEQDRRIDALERTVKTP
jgi:hypothetical protein